MRFGFVIAVGFLFSNFSFASFFEFKDQVLEQKAQSVEEALQLLPQQYRENYTLIHSGSGLMASSYEKPVVLMFNEDASHVINFNSFGHGRHEIEAITFDQETKEFSMHVLHFPHGGGAPVYQQNPHRCTRCHGQSPRPIWASYPIWRGVYGSDHDLLSKVEARKLAEFKAAAVDHPRYKVLQHEDPTPGEKLTTYPYHNEDNQEKAFYHRFRPNGRIGNHFAQLNAQRVAKKVLESEFFASYPYVSLTSMYLAFSNLDWPQCFYDKSSADYQSYLQLMDFVKSKFEARFPAEEYPQVVGNQQGIRGFDIYYQNFYRIEKLLTGVEVWDWDIKSVADFSRGLKERNTPQGHFRPANYVASQVVAQVVRGLDQDRFADVRSLIPIYKYRHAYSRYGDGSDDDYLPEHVAKYGILAIYERASAFLGAAEAYFQPQAPVCQSLIEKAMVEVQASR